MFDKKSKRISFLKEENEKLRRENWALEERIHKLEMMIPNNQELCCSELCKYCEHNKNKGESWENVICDLFKYNCKHFK